MKTRVFLTGLAAIIWLSLGMNSAALASLQDGSLQQDVVVLGDITSKDAFAVAKDKPKPKETKPEEEEEELGEDDC